MDFKVVTFFSYKGGSCRTSTALNTIPFLAAKNASSSRPLLVVDCDVDSVGMTFLLKEKIRLGEDFVSLLRSSTSFPTRKIAKESWDTHPVLKCLKPIGTTLGLSDNGSVLFLGSLNYVRYDSASNNGAAGDFFGNLKELCVENNFCGIIFDSAAGTQFVADRVTSMSHAIVTCMRPTLQFATGTAEYIYDFVFKKDRDYDTDFILVPTAIPKYDYVIDEQSQIEMSRTNLFEKISAATEELINNNKLRPRYNYDMISCYQTEQKTLHGENVRQIKDYGIPEIRRFRWREGILYDIKNKNGLLDDEMDAYRTYEKLASIIEVME